ncbi:transcriptional coactivator/pterin dehydratase [Chloropicon primus]|uniref:4a-hydroxytetrahydrobiopterin dehydratase n=1 Tax=Chloropicon primus TaxID=1764295 RepID=A0A5B8MJN5_9CHLO|nr:transcriptional coactivator/pterin dehydratase [Chloropicon primus]UPQ99504.1 transcriptional coactivator/pterin dehydratase [Chloropicon primus]|mmetsp:Transcript_4366/g.12848  ORF Transcript_4366/g.12848 Transcript_4366/m.12848 type:complete len:222 (+) Transcript_4366:107-772(+)|eukprot:QDZ20294.1 transcriptional coactivator/pterin dehydratase [Chloropicon primus]
MRSISQVGKQWSTALRGVSTAFGGRVGVRSSRNPRLVAMKAGGDLGQGGGSLQEKVEGAREAYAGEVETNFAENTLGNPDTEHIKKPPEKIKEIIGLAKKRCIPCEGKDIKALTESEADLLRKQVPGWKLEKAEGNSLRLNCDWKFKNFVKSLEFFQRIAEVAEAEGHHPDLHLVGWNKVTVEIFTHAVGGLTENDFILAAKINDIDTSDLTSKKKPKFWA